MQDIKSTEVIAQLQLIKYIKTLILTCIEMQEIKNWPNVILSMSSGTNDDD